MCTHMIISMAELNKPSFANRALVPFLVGMNSPVRYQIAFRTKIFMTDITLHSRFESLMHWHMNGVQIPFTTELFAAGGTRMWLYTRMYSPVTFVTGGLLEGFSADRTSVWT